MRSASSSIPIDMRTMSAGGTSSEPSAETCVIFCGCSTKDSTPPSDSARQIRRVFRQNCSACSGLWKRTESMPPKPRI